MQVTGVHSQRSCYRGWVTLPEHYAWSSAHPESPLKMFEDGVWTGRPDLPAGGGGRTACGTRETPERRDPLTSAQPSVGWGSLRLIIRNTDTDMEYCFFDIKLQDDEVRIGLCGMYDMGEMPSSGSLGKERLCTAAYDRPLEPDANGKREITASDILGIFWVDRKDCSCQ